jgi:Carbamoyl-phosphate synthase L chain, ATP binding domain
MSSGSNNTVRLEKPIGIYYEHPDWFRPLFEQMDALGAPWQKLDGRTYQYAADPGANAFSLVFNRMSPSAWQRGLGHRISYTLEYLAFLERNGVRVVNGTVAFKHEISKALQIELLERLQLPFPNARVIHGPEQALSAAEEIGYPLVVKPNIGGSGAGIVLFSNSEELARAVKEDTLFFGLDSTALLQEYFQARDSVITRVEVLGYKYLYAIQIHTTGETFNLCPADICQNTRGEELVRAACPIDAPKNGLKVEGYQPPQKVIEDVERIMQNAGIEVGGVEYAIDNRSGRLLYYDINALSNFVADPERIIGFNPYARLAEYLISEAQRHESQPTPRLATTGEKR